MSTYYSTVLEAVDDETDRHVDLVSFLGVLQKCNVELLPITWQPGLQLLGVGGTARVNQSHVNSRLGFAFKRMTRTGSFSSTPSYQHLISEVRALTAPNVRNHPNVIHLEGVCWEVEGKIAIPVLVFPKAEYGDLRAFRESEIGRGLSFEARKSLCINIGAGLMALHCAGIVHCDLRPENVLVDRVGTTWVARVSDVGYARVGLMAQDTISLPVSRPWTDPKWHRRGWQVATVWLMDIYSFGMVSLWLLLGDEISKHLGEESCFFVSHQTGLDTKLETWLMKDDLFPTVERLLKDANVGNDAENAKLSQLFRGLLATDHSCREQGIKNLGLSSPHAHEFDSQWQDQGHPRVSGLDHGDFRIAATHYRLCSSDYRVRAAIYNALKSRTREQNATFCEICSEKAEFQLAVCYKLGFGVRRSEEKSLKCISSCHKTSEDLEAEVRQIKTRALDSTYTESHYRLLFDQGFINWQNLPDRYRHDGITLDAESTLKWEISDTEQILGDRHASIFQLKDSLKALMIEQHRIDEAEVLQTEILKGLVGAFGENHADVIAASEHLCRIHLMQNRFDQAAKEAEDIINQRTKQQGPEHPVVWIGRGYLAEIWRRMGKLKDAEKEQMMLVERFEREFGKNHRQTLSIRSMLAATLQDQGRAQDSIPILEALPGPTMSAFGETSWQYFVSLGELANAYEKTGNWPGAETKYREALEGLQTNLGDRSKLTMTWRSKLIQAYTTKGHYERAERLEKGVVDWYENTYRESGQPRMALEVTSDIVHRQNMALRGKATNSPSLLSPISLPATRLRQDAWNIELQAPLAFRTFSKAVGESAALDALEIFVNLAVILTELGYPELGRPIISDALEGFTAICGADGEQTLAALRCLASICHRMGDITAVEPSIIDGRQKRRDKYGPSDTTYLHITEQVAKLYDLANLPEESLPLHEEIVEMSKCTLGIAHPDSLRRAYALSKVYKQNNHWSTLEALNSDFFWSGKMRREIKHQDLMLAGDFLREAYQMLGKVLEVVNVVQQMVDDFKEFCGPRNSTTLLFETGRASILFEIGREEEAISMCRHVIGQPDNPAEDIGYMNILVALRRLAENCFNHGRLEVGEELRVAVRNNSHEDEWDGIP